MVIDTSVLVAILFGEPEASSLARALEADPVRLIATPSLLETSIVIQSELEDEGMRELDLLMHTASISPVAFSADHYRVAREAYRRFGKGRHPAALNYGDCFSYALSRASGEPLLFKGEDFKKTDVAPVLL
ncbi:MAG: type II toxin-antitoxin system VapC family toxin [Pseudomonadales bacterium]|nr:type II toxin-antitoxin system VapC family toxin [Pseudomonadales bacterium]